MTRESRALQRQRAFTEPRRVGAPPPAAGEIDPALLAHHEALAEYRRRAAAPAALTAKEEKPDWIPLGPFGVRETSAYGSVWSGRVRGLAVSEDGLRVYAATANGGLWRSTDGGRSWAPAMGEDIDPLQKSGRVDTLACGAVVLVKDTKACADRLYLGTGEGPLNTTGPGGAFAGTGIWASCDGGTTWKAELAHIGPRPPDIPPTSKDALFGHAVFAIAVDPDDADHAMAATTNGLFQRYVDNGTPSWRKLEDLTQKPTAGIFVSVVCAKRNGEAEFFALGLDNAPIRLTKNGNNALPLTETVLQNLGRTFFSRGTLAVWVHGSDHVLYALLAEDDGSFAGLYLLELGDASSAWKAVKNIPNTLFETGAGTHQGQYDQAIAIDPENRNRVFLGGAMTGRRGRAALYRCEINPDTMTAQCSDIGARVHPDVHTLVYRPGSARELWVGCDGGVYTTPDARGADDLFQPRNTGLATLQLNSIATHPTAPGYAFGGAQDIGGLRYVGSEMWDCQVESDGGDTVIHPADPSRLLYVHHKNVVGRLGPFPSSDQVWQRSETVHAPMPQSDYLFYPPLVGCPDVPDRVAIGGSRPFVSNSFGGSGTEDAADWIPLPPPANTAPSRVASLAFASASRIYAGYIDGRLYRWDLVGSTWGEPRTLGAPTHGVKGALKNGLKDHAVTRIAVDQVDDPDQDTIYVTVGGALLPDRLFRVDVTEPVPGGPLAASWQTCAGVQQENRLPNTHHSVVVSDRPTAQRHDLYVGADIGVWRSSDGGQSWAPFGKGLPDAAVTDLRVVEVPPANGAPGLRLLRAATYGRGAWEIPLDNEPQRSPELMLRANESDQRRRERPARGELFSSPDIRFDPPDLGRYHVDPTSPVDLADLERRCVHDIVAVSVPGRPLVTQVHVIVRNRSVTPADGITVTLLLACVPPGQAVPTLPPGWAADVSAGTDVDTESWKTVGRRIVNNVRAGQPRVATIKLSSDLVPAAEVAEGHRFVLLAIAHHPGDPLRADAPVVLADLVRDHPHAAVRIAGPSRDTSSGDSLHVPLATALLTRHRLKQAVGRLRNKVHTPSAKVRPTERHVLALAEAALDNISAGPRAPFSGQHPGANIGSFALLGALGFELPGYTDLLGPGGGWVADLLRRGTPDPNMSVVRVRTTELALHVADRARVQVNGASVVPSEAKAFASGMLGAAAAGLVVSPQLADLLAVDTHRDWTRHSPSRGAAAVEAAIRGRFFSDSANRPMSPYGWLPPVQAVPPQLWEGLAATFAEQTGTPATRPRGWAAFEAGFDPGEPITAARLCNAYGLLAADLKTSSFPAWLWYVLLLPFVATVPLSLVAAHGLPHGGNFFKAGAEIDGRAVHEVLTLGFGMGAVPAFVASMELWALVDEHTEVFVNALVLGLVRAALVGAALGTAGNGDGLPVEARWLGLFAPLAAADGYAAVRAFLAGSRAPGDALVYALQTFPSMTALSTLGIAGLLKAVGLSHVEEFFWPGWAVLTAGLLGAAFPVAFALSAGGGYSSWFRRVGRSLPVRSAVKALPMPRREAEAKPQVFPDDRLWPRDSKFSDQRYPPGMRPLVRVWWEGAGDLLVKPTDNAVAFFTAGKVITVDVPHNLKVPDLVTNLTEALPGIRAEAEGTGDPQVPLSMPALADNGDQGSVAHHPKASDQFVPVGRTRADAVLLRSAPRVDLVDLPKGDARFPVVPAHDLENLEHTGLGHAADLAVLLTMAAAPSLGRVLVTDDREPLPDPVLPDVAQVFRRWNLDHRRSKEWQQMVAGGTSEPDEESKAPMIREIEGRRPHAKGASMAAAMGWLPLWRAWLTVAADPQQDTAIGVAHPDTPVIAIPGEQIPRQPTNRELTDGIRFLLDLGDPPTP